MTGMIANQLLWIAGIGGVIFYGIIFYWINSVVKKIEVKYSQRRVCLFYILSFAVMFHRLRLISYHFL
ncbi:hypothetical protein SSYIS1_40750 (plasmid) [Serratia symbiotica]|uniref:Uncharacterized protein n=1 Tax=Serratia symbiotica TaxID=138074 RepID=A0A455VVF1_9GAMM|nr:hypothetical protein SSYIS1_40750 [Serratia symbiotica]